MIDNPSDFVYSDGATPIAPAKVQQCGAGREFFTLSLSRLFFFEKIQEFFRNV